MILREQTELEDVVEQTEKKTRNNKVVKIEKRLNELVETDIQNPEIYELIKSLAAIYIMQNKYSYGYHSVDEVCHDVAADLWMSIINGRRIHAWIYYIGKMIKYTYVTKQRKIEHEIIEVGNDIGLDEGIKRMTAASFTSCINDFDTLNRNIMLENISGVVADTMNYVKFKKGSKEYSLLYLNLCINLVREIDGESQMFFRLPEYLKPFVKIAIQQYRKLFRNIGFTESIMDGIDPDVELKLIGDENALGTLVNGRGG